MSVIFHGMWVWIDEDASGMNSTARVVLISDGVCKKEKEWVMVVYEPLRITCTYRRQNSTCEDLVLPSVSTRTAELDST